MVNPPLKTSLKTPLKTHGGKYYLAKKIVSLMPKHLHYVEPYAGGLSVLLEKDPEGVSEVVNDLNGELTNFWSLLQDEQKFAEFHRMMQTTPFSEVEWNAYGKATLSSPFMRACRFFVRCRMSLAGRGDTFTGITKTRTRQGMNGEVSAWWSCVAGLSEVHARLKRVLILNRDALDVIRGQDGPGTLFYLDPPYLHGTRATTGEYGEYEMTLDQHRELLGAVKHLKGKVMLSGYPSLLYETGLRGWKKYVFDMPNNAAGGGSKRRMKECVWCNSQPARSIP